MLADIEWLDGSPVVASPRQMLRRQLDLLRERRSADHGRRPGRLFPPMEHFIAGLVQCLPDFTLMYAPNINSYKRFQPGSYAPTALRWGRDSRTCALRVVGRAPSLRMENRLPGPDVNPYLATAAMVAAGLQGIENESPLEPAYQATPTPPTRPA